MNFYLTNKEHIPFLDKNNNLLVFSTEKNAYLYRDIMLENEPFVRIKEIDNIDPPIDEIENCE